ncbi:hypothetical protein D3C71_1667140 [compost metagenome]
MDKHSKHDYVDNDLLPARLNAIGLSHLKSLHYSHFGLIYYRPNKGFLLRFQQLLSHVYQKVEPKQSYRDCHVLVFRQFFHFVLRVNAIEF